MSERYTVTFAPMSGVDGVRALRWLLKRARRQYGLIAVDVREEPASDVPKQVADAFVQLHRDVRRRVRGWP